jgi:predicted DNA-binding transcriptional regulator AlpA
MKEGDMAKRMRIHPAVDLIDDRFLRVDDVANLLGCSAGHVYMLEKFGHISESIDISVAGNGGSKRYSLSSVLQFIQIRKQSAGNGSG